MRDVKNWNSGGQRPEDDPFAELVRMTEQAVPRDPARVGSPDVGRFEDLPSDDSSNNWLIAAPGHRAQAPSVAPSVRSAQAEGPLRPIDRPMAGGAEIGNDEADRGAGFDEALLGLSEPAFPRDTRPMETGSFAPERSDWHREPTPQTITLDDFDQLIAGEMAALRSTETFGDEGPSQAPDLVEDHGFEDDRIEEASPPGGRYSAHHPALGGVGDRRRLLFFAGGLGAVALVGLFGAFAWSGMDDLVGGGGEPILIKADSEPIKIAPVDPGGRTVPNQNKAVYERVARDWEPAAPAQEMLIRAAEEPMDIDLDDGDAEYADLPGVMMGMSDIPDAPSTVVAEASEVTPILQPNRVRTFDVRPDGTLIPRQDSPPSAAPTTPPQATAAAVEPEPLRPMPPLAQPSPEATLPAEPQAPTPAEPEIALLPEPAPAQAAETPAAAPADGYYVQISSQPSQALAEQSRDNLGGRFASVIGGRPMTIQAAEIPDRGTYYRVRITAASREEANTVCENLQSSGGSCFVTR